MLYFYSLILGIVQGVTEFIPVSSSGHLVILHDLLQFNLQDSLAFDVALHLGTLLAVVIYFRIELLRYIVVILELFIPKRQVDKKDLSEVGLLIYGTIPAAIIGFLFEEQIKNVFRNTWTVVITLVLVSLLFFVAERFSKQKKSFSEVGFWQAFYIGCAQALALIPGVSRSGVTIVAGMSAKMKRHEAARFSFLLSVPVVLGAGIFKFLDVDWGELPPVEMALFIIGFLSSFIVGYIVIKFLMKFLQKHKLNVFAWYRLGLALLLLIWLLLK